MKALVEEVNPVQKRIKIELSETDVNNAFDNIYQNLRKKAHIKGFRPGKAPLNVLKKFYGNSVAADVADRLVRDHLFDAIEQESIQPIAAPVLETAELPEENQGYSFSAVVDIMPALEINGYKGLKLEYQAVDVDDAAVDREIEVIQRRQGKSKDVEDGAAAQSGHSATISMKGSLNGEDFAPFTFDSVPLELGKNQLLPEMEEAVIGLKVGEEKQADITIPEHFHDKDLVGQKVSCTIKLEGLQEQVLPEANDELAKDMGLDSLDALKTSIRDNLERQAEQQKRNQLEGELLQQLSDKNEFEVPPSMVDQVIDSMFQEMDFKSDDERERAKKNPEQRQALRDSAKQRAKNTLILSEIIKAESLEVTDDDLDQYVRDMISGAGQQDIDENMVAQLKQSLGQQAKESLLFRKAIDFVIDSAEVTAKTPAES
jgi:trigger factor